MTKTSFSALLSEADPHKDDLVACGAYHTLKENKDLTNYISTWLLEQGFDDWELVSSGNAALVVAPKDNPDIVLKLRKDYKSGRENKRFIPHLMQPLFLTEFGSMVLEFTPRIQMEKQNQGAFQELHNMNMSEAEFLAIRDRLKQEINASGYGYAAPYPGLCKFTYEDPKKSGRLKTTVICYDHDDVISYPDKPQTSQCTSEYPGLEAQYREHAKIIAREPRLQKLISNAPQPSYKTKKISGGTPILNSGENHGTGWLRTLFGGNSESKSASL